MSTSTTLKKTAMDTKKVPETATDNLLFIARPDNTYGPLKACAGAFNPEKAFETVRGAVGGLAELLIGPSDITGHELAVFVNEEGICQNLPENALGPQLMEVIGFATDYFIESFCYAHGNVVFARIRMADGDICGFNAAEVGILMKLCKQLTSGEIGDPIPVTLRPQEQPARKKHKK